MEGFVKISVVVPVYEMHGVGIQMLERSLDILERQTFKDFEVVVTDDSDDVKLVKLCDDFTVKYLRNPGDKGIASNTNFGIKQAKGELIKILYQDDYLAYDEALEDIVKNFENGWLITACSNTLIPHYNDKIRTGYNTIGSPSVLTIKNDNPLLFDTSLKWLVDCEYYQRTFERYGEPKILLKPGVVIGIGDWQQTNQLTNEQKNEEYLRLQRN